MKQPTKEQLAQAVYEFLQVATFPSWAAGDCRYCKHDQFNNGVHDEQCSYGKTEDKLWQIMEQLGFRKDWWNL